MMDAKPTLMRRLTRTKLFWPLLALALMLAFNLFFTKGFFHVEIKDGHFYGSLIDILNRAAPLMLISIGMTLVMATGGIDISVGAVVAIAGAIVAMLISGSMAMKGGVLQYVTLIPMPLAILATLTAAALFGLWNGLLVSRGGMQPIVATLILLVAGRGVAQLINNGQITTIDYLPFIFVGNGFLLGFPFSLYIVLAVLLATLWLVRRTALGLFIEAIGINPKASRMAGINAQSLLLWVYAFCGLCAGIAGLIVCSNVKCADGNNAGMYFELDAILAVVLGGTSTVGGKFYLLGSIVGALIIQTLTTTIYSIGVPPEIILVVKAVVVFVVMIFQSETFRTTVFTHLGGKASQS
jgi:simple sugar transport system permease protein